MFEDNYPEGLKRLFVIKGKFDLQTKSADSHLGPCFDLLKVYGHDFYFVPPAAPKLFPVAFNLVKPFLSEITRQKIYILGGG